MEFRIGVNIGDIIVEGERIYGGSVNVAARLEKLADPGGICISRSAYEQVEDKMFLGYEYMGRKRVKNMNKPLDNGSECFLSLIEQNGSLVLFI
jgi:class 3 adenylate cyclase